MTMNIKKSILPYILGVLTGIIQIIAAQNIAAQTLFSTEASTEELKGMLKARAVTLEVDFSKALIHKMTVAEFAEYDPSFAEEKDDVIKLLVKAYNEEKKIPFSIVKSGNNRHKLKLTIVNVDRKGNTKSYAELLTPEEKWIARTKIIKGEGGSRGSNMNLMGDGFKSTGQELASEMRKVVRELQKSRY